MSYKYMLLDSRGAPVAQGVSEDGPEKNVWQLRIAHGDIKRVLGHEYISLVGLQGFEKSYPSQLSGGMKQRAGIARAYTNNPEIMLMDEPFGQLDAQTRYSMQDEVLRIWESEKRTFIFVTNNIEEALYLADRIVLLTNYPAQVKEIYDINLPRPRDTVSPEFLRLRKIISDNTDLAL